MTLLTIDPTLSEWFARPGRAGHQATPQATPQAIDQPTRQATHSAAVQYLADPFPDAKATEPLAARERLGLGTGKHVLVYGSITERKGIQELVTALAQRAGSDPLTLVVAGVQDDETRAFFAAAGGLSPPAVFMDRFITTEEELDLFSACDVVWLGYKGHYGMSGVLVQAYRFRKAVVATADGLIGWFCRTGELGPVVDDLSVTSINRAFDKVFEERPAAAPAGPHLLERNTLSHFKQTLRQAII